MNRLTGLFHALDFTMAIDFFLRSFRYSADLFMDVIGIIHLPKRNRLPPVSDSLLLQSATDLTSQIRTGQVSDYINFAN